MLGAAAAGEERVHQEDFLEAPSAPAAPDMARQDQHLSEWERRTLVGNAPGRERADAHLPSGPQHAMSIIDIDTPGPALERPDDLLYRPETSVRPCQMEAAAVEPLLPRSMEFQQPLSHVADAVLGVSGSPVKDTRQTPSSTRSAEPCSIDIPSPSSSFIELGAGAGDAFAADLAMPRDCAFRDAESPSLQMTVSPGSTLVEQSENEVQFLFKLGDFPEMEDTNSLLNDDDLEVAELTGSFVHEHGMSSVSAQESSQVDEATAQFDALECERSATASMNTMSATAAAHMGQRAADVAGLRSSPWQTGRGNWSEPETNNLTRTSGTRWSDMEVEKLMLLVEKHGTSDWVAVATTLGSRRTAKAVRAKYHKVVMPAVSPEQRRYFVEKIVGEGVDQNGNPGYCTKPSVSVRETCT